MKLENLKNHILIDKILFSNSISANTRRSSCTGRRGRRIFVGTSSLSRATRRRHLLIAELLIQRPLTKRVIPSPGMSLIRLELLLFVLPKVPVQMPRVPINRHATAVLLLRRESIAARCTLLAQIEALYRRRILYLE